ncbi:type II toxin-antitoxin system HicB family antitoxin [Desulfolutivibrio sulfoxidireducens]|uniref:type II toxin-antitoxin system HicB family antitoxin n=1 Tax=Desulfolutivibrio sulfoxidireducens TaxID=2773299 RepID=UPI00159DA269|nr:type II toxin-antitoxin system HicB family antitoxin [Desulfolutivibrio sulfoxidireducens]QLA17033.1 type II toxin-antitoxin system HicB family antitoxin [Desulfolutivibrio sulfoxidireducens]
MYTYPVTLKTLGNGDVMASFPDVPEAVTYGENEAFALEWAQDALHVALAGYMDDHRDIPPASTPAPGQPTVGPSPLTRIKLAIYQAMRDQGISQLRLAGLLHRDARQVRRILDLDHQSTLNQLVDAAAVLGFRLDVALCKADADDVLPTVQAAGMGTAAPARQC